jgi:DNA-binding NarL/FixJ family response regulator
MIKVLVADDHKMFVDGIESILRNEEDIQVVGKCFDGTTVFAEIEDKDPDVLLLDISLPEMSGIDVCKRLTATHPKIRVLAVSMHNDASFISEILKNGAMGYILKNTGKAELVTAIKNVYEGKSYFSKEVAETIMQGLVQDGDTKKKSSDPQFMLSEREKEILALIAEEFTTQEIAQKLHLSFKTVEGHRRNLFSKLNVRNAAGLVRVALENNLINV